MAARVEELDKVFVVHLWREKPSLDTTGEHWRARVDYVNTGQEFTAAGLERAFVLIRSLLMTDQDSERLGS